ncbi:lithostathine [Holotrichia oblita]|uniref:Lithostathine n=1 Tax=Holotrichia oblita TaxID=644536 RepID=A0ACB9TDN0_HOLOL|nr:lithostathine [Holotrichia oblita]
MNSYFVMKCCVLLQFLHLPHYSCVFECIDYTYNHCFIKMHSCRRFDDPIALKREFQTLAQCANYARERSALAFNYSPPEAARLRKNVDYLPNCQILGCPDIGYTNMINDSDYDYYTVYKNLSEESTCIKWMGMFHLFQEKMNYIDSVSACQSIGGDLANVVSEARTNALSLLLSNKLTDWQKVAYVGLDDRRKEGRFVTSLGNFLSCYKYRAWGPGQPRSKHRNEDCVLLDSDKTWRVVNCKLKFSALCEIYPKIPPCSTSTIRSERGCELIH